VKSFQITESLDHSTWVGEEVIVVKQRGGGGTRALIQAVMSVTCALYVASHPETMREVQKRIEDGSDDIKVAGWRNVLEMLKTILMMRDSDVQFISLTGFTRVRGDYDIVVFDEVLPEDIPRVRTHALTVGRQIVYLTTIKGDPPDAIKAVAEVLDDE
jgi:hypothetical protein